MGKKLCGVLLALVMALSLLPTVAVADTVTEIGSSYSWTQTNDNLYFELDEGNYKLISNVEVAATILVTGNVTLDLNGYVLNLKSEICNIGGGNNAKGSVIQVGTDSSVGHLTLKDSSTTEENISTAPKHNYTVDNDTGLWKLCTTEGCGHTSHNTLTGGVITGGYIDSNEGSPKPGSGVYVAGTNSTFTMTGGSIIGCVAKNGGGVLVAESGCTFKMTDGLIAGCTATSGGVTVGQNATFTMTGGTIRDCVATQTDRTNTTLHESDALCVNGSMNANGGDIYGTVLSNGKITTDDSTKATKFHNAVKLGSGLSCPDIFEVEVSGTDRTDSGNTDGYYQSFTEAWDKALGESCTFKLLKNVDIAGNNALPVSRRGCTIDLNGKTLNGNFKISKSGNSNMPYGLTVTDNSTNKDGTLVGTVEVEGSNAVLTISGGTINTVTNNTGGTLNAHGGTIKNVTNNGTITRGGDTDYTTFENISGSGTIDPTVCPYTVTFNLNGGTGTAPEAQGILKGQTAIEPTQAPTAPNNCVFGGWYTAQNGGTKFDFSTAITGNTTLYAKWVKKIQSLNVTMCIDGVKQSGLENAKVTYDGNPHTVTFVIKDGNYTLVEGTDYTVTGNTETAEGYYELAVTGIGEYAANTGSDNSWTFGWQITAASTTGTKPHYVKRAAVTGTVIGAADYTSGNTGLTFKSSAAFSSFQGVQVDGKTIDSRHYIAEAGSIEVYLKATYLQTLAAGKHTVTILSTEGNVTMDFTVGGVTSAKTFDAGAGIYAVTALLSYTGSALVIRGRKKS